ncbi:MAG: Ppx/GppA family phosphatase [Peptococcaceae bacterium]|nr:Ppx/GppA family phosphatase [Peptococcaceae bacterium]
MRVGAVDIGTNSTRLLIAEVEDGRVRPLRRALETTRLGAGLREGILLPESINRTVTTLCRYRGLLQESGVTREIAVATSAVRDAANRDEFVEVVKGETGFDVRVINGHEEAAYSFGGVVSGLSLPPDQVLVMDVGGGSTEFVWQNAGVLQKKSLALGAVRMTLESSTSENMREVLRPVAKMVSRLSSLRLVGVGGTCTTLAAIDLKMEHYDPDGVHGYILTRRRVGELLDELARCTLEERQRIPGLQPERADIIVAGVRIVFNAMMVFNRDQIQVSEADILYGLALNAAQDVEQKGGASY